MKSIQFKTSLVILISALSGCNLENINQYGNNCAEWAYVLNGNNISCNSETLEDCNEAFQVARKAGKCPERFEIQMLVLTFVLLSKQIARQEQHFL